MPDLKRDPTDDADNGRASSGSLGVEAGWHEKQKLGNPRFYLGRLGWLIGLLLAVILVGGLVCGGPKRAWKVLKEIPGTWGGAVGAIALAAAVIGGLSLAFSAIRWLTRRWLQPGLSRTITRTPYRTRKGLLLVLTIVFWASWLTASVLLYEANHHFPRGPMVPTGEYTESRREGGTGGDEIYVEDVRALNVPGWVKFFKRAEGTLLWLVLLSGAVAASKVYGDHHPSELDWLQEFRERKG
jgi:hypothetical protein